MESEASLCMLLHRYTKALSVALGFRDLLTQHHSERVRGLCELVGERYGLTERQLDILRLSAAFHDVGKIGIPDGILLKAAPCRARRVGHHEAAFRHRREDHARNGIGRRTGGCPRDSPSP